MSKTIEEIRNEIAIDFGYKNLDQLLIFNDSCIVDIINKVAERYAQSQTHEIKEQNAELVNSLSKLVLLLEEIDSTLFHHNHSIDGWHLNGDLEPIMNFVNDMDLEPITKAKELLTKHNHLKSNRNGSI